MSTEWGQLHNKATLIKKLAAAAAVSLAFVGAAQAAPEAINIGPNGESMSYGYWYLEQAFSANGSVAVFTGTVPGQNTNGAIPAWIRDRQAQSTQMVSKTLGGQAANVVQIGGISANGRYVTFSSFDDKLVSGDTNNSYDIFVADRNTGLISRANVANDGTQAEANSYTVVSTISADGRYVVFTSSARNLQNELPDNGYVGNVYVRDLIGGTTKRMNVTSSNTNGTPLSGQPSNSPQLYPLISGDGRFVAFYSPHALTPNGTGLYIRDQLANTTTALPILAHSQAYWALSTNGRYISYYNRDTYDVEVFDRQSNTVEKIATNTNNSGNNKGNPAHTSISASGRYVTYMMSSTNPPHSRV